MFKYFMLSLPLLVIPHLVGAKEAPAPVVDDLEFRQLADYSYLVVYDNNAMQVSRTGTHELELDGVKVTVRILATFGPEHVYITVEEPYVAIPDTMVVQEGEVAMSEVSLRMY